MRLETKPFFIRAFLPLIVVLTALVVGGSPVLSPFALAANDARGPAEAPQRPDADKIMKVRGLAAEGKVEAAEKLLGEAIEAEKDRERRALMRMTSAVILYQFGNIASQNITNDSKAEAQFLKAIEEGVRVPDYAYYYVGLLRKKHERGDEARAALEKVINAKTNKSSENDARFQLADLHLKDKKWSEARGQLEALRKNLKGDERLPEVLFGLMRVERKTGRRAQACKWARELYAKYPTTAGIREWGPRLEQNAVDGEKLAGCGASSKDLRTRVRRLWLHGDSERAAAELKLLKDATDDEGYSLVDSLSVNHMISDGHIDEALKFLLSRYDEQKNRPPYLLLLAKAASGAGDYQVAVNAYERAYELAPRGKNGLNSLFQAAFTSYQMQDYDGASRRFESLIRVARASKLGREAQWYVSWIRYLRGDYPGALESFKSLGKSPRVVSRRRGRRRHTFVASDAVAQDRMQYWSAMSLLKMGRAQEAIPVFQSLARDPSLGYYAILSYYRLAALDQAHVPPVVEMHFGLKHGEGGGAQPSEAEIKNAAAVAAEEAQAEFEETVKTDAAEEGDKEEAMAAEGEENGEGRAPETVPTFRDGALANRFERVRDLVLVGLEDGARRELREIEKRARSAVDRKLLMTEFANVKNFERSSYIGETGFGAARLSGGLRGSGRMFWEYAYPRAWESAVAQASRSTSVPEELIWGIMRAESHFRYDAQSPVGALGLMQLMPFTGRKVADLLNLKTFETRSLLEPETNIKLGSRYLQRLVEKFSGKVPLVAGAYNAGPHRVYAWVRNFGSLDMDEFIEHIPYIETRNYVKRVARNFQIYRLLYAGPPSLQAMRWMIQPVGVQLSESLSTREVW